MQLAAFEIFCNLKPIMNHSLEGLISKCIGYNFVDVHKEYGSTTKALYNQRSENLRDILSKGNTKESFESYSIRQLATLCFYSNAPLIMFEPINNIKLNESKMVSFTGLSKPIKREDFDEIVASWVGVASSSKPYSELAAGSSEQITLADFVERLHSDKKVFIKHSTYEKSPFSIGCGNSPVNEDAPLSEIIQRCNVSEKYLSLFDIKQFHSISVNDLRANNMTTSTDSLLTIFAKADVIMRSAEKPIGSYLKSLASEKNSMESESFGDIARLVTGLTDKEILQRIFPIANLSMHNMSSLADTLGLKSIKQVLMLSLNDIIQASTGEISLRMVLRRRIQQKSRGRYFIFPKETYPKPFCS